MTTTSSLASRSAGSPTAGLLGAALAGAGTTLASAGGPAGPGLGGALLKAAITPVLPARTARAGSVRSTVKSTKTTKAKSGTTAAKKSASTKAGYAKTTLPAEFAFLRDPKLSIEEKLSRFCGLIMAKAEKDLLAQMEKMAPGAKTSASASAASGAAPKKKKGFSIWGAVKTLLPPVGLAANLLGEAATKKLVQQLTGPVLAGAATALGMPQLAPLALKAGSSLGGMVTDEGSGAGSAVVSAVAGLLGGAGGVAGTAGAATAAGSSGTTAAAGSSSTKAADEPRSEKADQLELQRLMEREKETFTLLSNILRMNHEARMTSVQNIR